MRDDPRNVPAQPHVLATLTTTARVAIGGMLLLVLGLGATATVAVSAGQQQVRTAVAAGDEVAAVSGKLPGELFHRTELYFGQSKPDGEVTDEDFAKFLDVEVTPRFPDGLTLLSGLGQFAGSAGPVEERSKVLILLYPMTDVYANREIEEIRAVYQDLFDQESVLRVDDVEGVSF